MIGKVRVWYRRQSLRRQVLIEMALWFLMQVVLYTFIEWFAEERPFRIVRVLFGALFMTLLWMWWGNWKRVKAAFRKQTAPD